MDIETEGGLGQPATKAVAITPDDDTDLEFTPRALYIGGAGAVTVILRNDTAAVTFAAVPVGTVLPVRPKRVLATGTDATLLLGLR